MATFVALLRAVNVAGHQSVGMADLRDLLTQMGFEDARSLLQSGNLLFRGEGKTTGALERLLEAGARKRLGLDTDIVVRSTKEWSTVVAANPFRKEAERDPGRLVVMFLKSPAVAKSVSALQAAITGPEVVRGEGKHLYIVYPNGQGRSRLTNKLMETKLGTSGTARNWNTVMKVAALL